MGRQLVLSASFSLFLLAIVFTPVCHGRPHGAGEQLIHTEDEVDSLLEELVLRSFHEAFKNELEAEDENEDEMDDVDILLLARLLDDQSDNLIDSEMSNGERVLSFKQFIKKIANFSKKVGNTLKKVVKGAMNFCNTNKQTCVNAIQLAATAAKAAAGE